MMLPVEAAAQILKRGGVVAFPTETVYGLGADAANARAVCRVFEVKKRPAFDPLIVHVSSVEMAQSLWSRTPDLASRLMKEFWPGPLTLVLPKAAPVLDVVTAGLPNVAVRMPNHPMALELIRSFGGPIAAPSANLFGYTSATTAQAVKEDFGNTIDAVLDAGPCVIGVESTVIKIEDEKIGLLRPGGISVEALKKFADVVQKRESLANAPESPGQLDSHYAPWTKLALLEGPLSEFLKKMEAAYALSSRRSESKPWPRIGLLLFSQEVNVPFAESTVTVTSKGDLLEGASNLFQAIRKLDKMNLDWIVAESVPEQGIGLAIMDRLRKASGGKRVDEIFWNDDTTGDL